MTKQRTAVWEARLIQHVQKVAMVSEILEITATTISASSSIIDTLMGFKHDNDV